MTERRKYTRVSSSGGNVSRKGCLVSRRKGVNVSQKSQKSQKAVPIIYKGNKLKTDLRLDLLVEDEVVVELKSVSEMKDIFYKQTLTYLRLLDKRLGILVNFNVNDIMKGAIIRVVNGL